MRTFLQVHSGEIETFASTRRKRKQFVQASKAWDVVHKDPNAMDVDAVVKGKGKSKGKGGRTVAKGAGGKGNVDVGSVLGNKTLVS